MKTNNPKSKKNKRKNEILQRYHRHLMRLPRPYMQGDDAKNQKPFKLHGST
jgi:hypothetical protein